MVYCIFHAHELTQGLSFQQSIKGFGSEAVNNGVLLYELPLIEVFASDAGSLLPLFSPCLTPAAWPHTPPKNMATSHCMQKCDIDTSYRNLFCFFLATGGKLFSGLRSWADKHTHKLHIFLLMI